MKLNIAVAALSVSAASAAWPGIAIAGMAIFTVPLVGGQTAPTQITIGTPICGDTVGLPSFTGAAFCDTSDGSGGAKMFTLSGAWGLVTLDTCDDGSSFDTKIRVYTNSGTCVAGNDDSCGNRSRVTFSAVGSETYNIWVHGYDEEEGTYCLNSSIESPTNAPSTMPSQTPSDVPSTSPSTSPSAVPSDQPSGKPSQSPSVQPSGQPSSMPSCTPSVGPTPSPSINLFYPDQTQAGFETGCLNDGQQPAWMEANPTNWLHSTLNKCCTQHFSWNYDFCMGNLDDTCARALWYPDWEKANKGCVRDGEEPLYMTANSGIYLYNTKADCCEEHYSWDLATCMGGAAGSTSGTKWYADWETGDDTCKNDGKAPDYMVATSVNWLYADKKDCCTRFFSYSLADCMGTYTSSKGSGKYYPDWAGDNEGCLVDKGSTPAPEYMRATEAWFYDTLDKCCEKHYGYNLSGCKGQAATASATAYTGNEKWYLMWSSGKCVQDCATKTGTKCGGFSDSWDIKYESQAKCCNERSWWNIKECMA